MPFTRRLSSPKAAHSKTRFSEKIYLLARRRYTSSRREDILIWQVSNTWQLCDIAIFIKKHFTAEDSIQDKLDRCGISQISAAIGHILHKDLGLDKDLIPFRISSKGAEIIREDIWAGGNFGKKRYGHVSNYNFIHRKLTMLPVHCRQYLRYRELLPNEAWANLISKFGRAAKGIK